MICAFSVRRSAYLCNAVIDVLSPRHQPFIRAWSALALVACMVEAGTTGLNFLVFFFTYLARLS